MHALDMTAGKPAIAYRGELPWHGLGEQITANMSLEQMMSAAALDWSVLELPALYSFKDTVMEAKNRKALVRSDSGDFLAHMSKNKYEVRQPKMIVEFFRDICDTGGFEIETLGALNGGRNVWAMAKRKGGCEQLSQMIKPGILLVDSYDGSKATTAKFLSTTVVCANTLAVGLGESGGQVKIGHATKFNADKVKAQLGDIDQVFGAFLDNMKKFSEVKMSADFKKRFFMKLLAPKAFGEEEGKGATWKRMKIDEDAISTNAQNKIAELLRLSDVGNAPGSDIFSNTAYNAVQTITYYADHEAQTKGEGRWNAATFGNGAKLKDAAFELASSLVD